jgi:hypothetical protein
MLSREITSMLTNVDGLLTPTNVNNQLFSNAPLLFLWLGQLANPTFQIVVFAREPFYTSTAQHIKLFHFSFYLILNGKL